MIDCQSIGGGSTSPQWRMVKRTVEEWDEYLEIAQAEHDFFMKENLDHSGTSCAMCCLVCNPIGIADAWTNLDDMHAPFDGDVES